MAEGAFRDLGAFVPGPRVGGPVAPPPEAPSQTQPTVLVTPPPAPTPRPVFAGEGSDGADTLGIEGTIGRLAELVAHRATATPLPIGILGGPGAGKSFAMARLVARVRDLCAAAAKVSPSPFLSRLHVQSIDAAGLHGDPATALAASLHAGLRQAYPDLARELGHTARDPHVVLREIDERLDQCRIRLDSERRALDDASSRRARLVETVLYEAAGSQVDTYARANRAGIENRLLSFGVTGDPIRNFKDFVHAAAGPGARLGLALRSLYAFRGQTRLIVAAIVLVAIGIGLGVAIDDQDAWLAAVRNNAQSGAPVADWLQTHIGLLATAKTVAFGLAALAILDNFWRASTFLRPILKGERLLESDLDNRRRDLDGHVAHHTKRVDALDGDVERLSRDSAEAERRAGGIGSPRDPSPFDASGAAPAQTFFAALATAMDSGGGGAVAAPERIFLAIDHLDAVAPDRARDILDNLHRCAGRGLVTAIAVDVARLDRDGAHRGALERWIQVPLRLDAGPRDYGALVQTMLGHAKAVLPPRTDARVSVLDTPIDRDEAALLSALAGVAGRSPRAVRRFVLLYTLARMEGGNRGALALMFALMQGGTEAETAAVAAAAGGDGASAFEVPQATPRLRTALDAVFSSYGRFSNAEAVEAARHAAMYAI